MTLAVPYILRRLLAGKLPVAVSAVLFSLVFSCGLKGQPRELPYKDGETLHYAMNYKWGGINTDVGSATVQLEYGDGIFHAVVEGHTFKFYDIFFKVREHFESRFYAQTLRPASFYRDTYEGKHSMKNIYNFDKENYNIHATVQKNDRPPRDTVLPGTASTYDLVTLFFACRTLDFSKIPTDVPQPISFAIDTDIYDLYYIYKGKEVKKIQGLGTFKTLKFSAKLVAGDVFTGKEEMTIWITDDENKIPLLFESPIIVGKVSGRLTEWEELKYPVTSKIK